MLTEVNKALQNDKYLNNTFVLHNQDYRVRAGNRIVQAIYTEQTPQQKFEKDRKLHASFLASLKLPRLNNAAAPDKSDSFFKT